MPNPEAQTTIDLLAARGVKKAHSARRPAKYIGEKATPFNALEVELEAKFTLTNTDVAKLGSAYDMWRYRESVVEANRAYEKVFAGIDWAGLSDSDLSLLRSIYGDTDSATEFTPEDKVSILDILGRQVSLLGTRSLKERSEELQASQTTIAAVRDDAITGIRGVGDVGGELEPVV